MCRDGQWKRVAQTSITGAWDGASLNTGLTPCHRLHGNHIWESALEAHVLARYIVPGLNPSGRESALEAHGTPHTY